MKRAAAAAVVVLAVAALVIFGLRTSSTKRERAAPELTALPLTAHGHALKLADLRGRPTVINFFASWCHPCRAEAPGLRDLATRMRAQVNVVGVDWSDNPADGRAFVLKVGWTYPTLFDPNGRLGRKYGITGLPVTFVLDPRGQIRDALRGQQTEASVLRAMRRAI
jgi:cytochrome c biogenesis protein CcmG/thiol:disulfide interchange protein DsbE